MRRFLRPIVGLVLAISVAIGAAVIGARFASPETVAVEPGVITAPVLAPVAIGDEQPDIDGAPSETVAMREVTLPGAPVDGVTPTARIVFDEMGDSLDPITTLGMLEAEAASEPAPTDGDPCAPRDGEPTADCPEGLESTVLSVVSPRDLAVGGQAFPPTWERYLAEGNPYGGSLWCDGLVAEDGDVPFGILATVPGTSTVSYWPTADPENVTTLPAISASAAEIAAYESALATLTDPREVPFSQGCLVLPDLLPSTDYSARILHFDVFDRIATSSIERFHSDGAPTRPGAQIAVLGDNFVFASALHTRTQSVDARAWLYDDVASADCSGTGSDGRISEATYVDTTVDSDFLASINALPDYTGKSVYTYRVPEGATVIVCMRWFPAGDSPSWEREQHDYQSEVVLQSPDRILPVVTLTELEITRDDVAAVITSASTTEGGLCSSFPAYQPAFDDDLTLPMTLCSEHSLVEGGIRVADDRIHDVGFSGDILISSEIELVDGGIKTRGWVLPLSRELCRGVCELPKPNWFTLQGAMGLPEYSRAVIGIEWVQGRQNGLTDWNVLPSSDSEVGYVSPDLAQMNTERVPLVRIDERALSASAELDLEVDRPVTYTVRVVGVSESDPCLLDPAASSTRTGSASPGTATRVSFSSLCLGTQYRMQVELTDTATGVTVIWGVNDRISWWGNGFFNVDGLDVTVSYDWIAQGVVRSAMTNLELVLDGTDLDAVNERGGMCTADGIVSGSDSGVEASLSSNPRVFFSVRLRPSDDFAPDDCFGSLRDGSLNEMRVNVSLRDLLRPEGVIIEIPETRARIHLWAYRV